MQIINNMDRRRSGSQLKYQITEALESITFLGTSKKLARKQGKKQIHSYKQLQNTISDCMNFAKWLKEQNITSIYHLKSKHYKTYIEFLLNKDLAFGTIMNIETSLRILAEGMKATKNYKCWVPEKRMIHSSQREEPVNRSLTEEEIGNIKISENARIAMILQLAFGLRLREVVKTTSHYIEDKGNGELWWTAVSDREAKNTAIGVTKAGRGRNARCLDKYKEQVLEIIGSHMDFSNTICPLTYNALKSAYTRANIGGSHAFRHTYARNMLYEEAEIAGLTLETCNRFLDLLVENKSLGYRRDKGISLMERKEFRNFLFVVDRVHEYLGHGKNRMDLLLVYMAR